MRLLWGSNYSAQSGYAIQARLFVPRIKALGHTIDVLELANGARLPYGTSDGIQVLPVGFDPLGSDMIGQHFTTLKADCTITLCDAWGFSADVMRSLNWYPLVPIDTEPAAPAVVESLRGCQRPIAYSPFGIQQLRTVGFDPLYLPHAVDPSIWHPMDKQQARHQLNIPPHWFYVSFVGVNDSAMLSRKGIPELLCAWQVFSRTHPDARLYLHTTKHGNLPVNPQIGGVRIDVIIQTLGIDPATVLIADEYKLRTGIPASALATIAAASDVLVLPTIGEGFGLPLLEFQRVGCPVITTDFAAGKDLIFGGWGIPFEPTWSWQSAFVAKPSIAALVEALEAAYADRDNPARKAQAIAGARAYDIDTVMSKYAVPVLKQIAEETVDRVRISA